MSYIKKLLFASKEIIITYILEYVIIFISCFIYKISINNNLNSFINNQLQYISSISLIVITIILYKKYKRKETKIIYKYIPIFISIGISISCLINMLLYKFFTINTINNRTSLLLIISSGLIGPIYEEILFRYIHLYKLKKFNSSTVSILVNSLIFSLLHFNIKEIIFAFILSISINIIYKKYNNIIYPIIIHSSVNIFSIFLIEYNQTIIILSMICLIINLEIINNNS